MDYDFPYVGNFIIPTDELIFFRGVETTNQICIWEYQYIIQERYYGNINSQAFSR